MLRASLCVRAVGALGFALAATAAAQDSADEKQRLQLMQHLGIHASPKPEPGADAGAVETPAASPPTNASAPKMNSGTTKVSFASSAQPVLEHACASCHRAGGMAATSGFILGGDARSEYLAAQAHVDTASPAHSVLLKKASGETTHGGGKVIAVGSPEYAAVLKWVADGARFGSEGAAVASPAHERAVSAPATAPAAVAQPEPAPVLEAAPPAPLEAPDAGVPFASVAPLLVASCGGCHGPGKLAAATRYSADADLERHFESAHALVTPGVATTSLLDLRARGTAHAGGAVFPPGSAGLAALDAWINAGAIAPQSAPVPIATAPGAPSASPTLTIQPGAPVVLAALPVIGTLRLNGRFDLSLERTNYTDNPFISSAQTGLQSYHHFLFVTRESADDPLMIVAEVTSLQMWEISLRLSRQLWPVRLTVKAGKLLVPFGAEPLYHHSYGGTSGFDQKVLPPVFAREGANLNVQGQWHGVSLSLDTYSVAGYRLQTASEVLDLQNSLAPLDDLHLAVGGRAGASWGPFSLWYSGLYNPLGFGRRLYLQALDLIIARPRGIPVLQHFSFGFGLLRADVSGGASQGYGGPGSDYYHFASYFEVRYYPTDWLYFQYRQGLRTFDNRQGLYIDGARLTQADSSSQNVGIVVRWYGVSVGLYQFWNFEKVNEIPNDLTRLMVAYDF